MPTLLKPASEAHARVQPLDLPRVDRGSLARQNSLSRPRQTVSANSAAGRMSVAPATEDILSRWQGSWARVEVMISDRLAELIVPIDVMLHMSAQRFPELPFDGLDPRLRGTIAEYMFDEPVRAMEAMLHAPVRFGQVHCPVPLGGAVDFTFEVRFEGGGAFPAALRCSPVDRNTLAFLIGGMKPVRQRPAGLRIPVSLRAGYSTINLHDLGSLAVGSGILLDGTYLTFQKIAAVTGERFVQTCTWQSLKPVLDGPLLRSADPATSPFTTGPAMNDSPIDNHDAPPGTIRDVPVHLVFELGRMAIDVNEIETLAQGYVFDLGKPLSQAVEILSGGRRIGAGELVRIGDSIGVRVTRIAT